MLTTHSYTFILFQYVLNVTPDLPNVFEDQGSIKYMQIPITDHWSQNLASHFPKAIEFIGELEYIVTTNFYSSSIQIKEFCQINYLKVFIH